MPSFDAFSFSELYDRYYADVFRFSYWISGNREDAKDITSETFTRIWTVETELNAQTVKGYLLTVARNVFLQGLKKKANQTTSSDNNSDIDVESELNTENDVVNQKSVERVVKALQLLGEPDRSILVMKAYEGLSYQEIASIYNMTVSTLKTRVHRARVKLALSADIGENNGY